MKRKLYAYYCPKCKKRIWRFQWPTPPRYIESFCSTVGFTTKLRLSRNQRLVTVHDRTLAADLPGSY
jgi:hypothetical protein